MIEFPRRPSLEAERVSPELVWQRRRTCWDHNVKRILTPLIRHRDIAKIRRVVRVFDLLADLLPNLLHVLAVKHPEAEIIAEEKQSIGCVGAAAEGRAANSRDGGLVSPFVTAADMRNDRYGVLTENNKCPAWLFLRTEYPAAVILEIKIRFV